MPPPSPLRDPPWTPVEPTIVAPKIAAPSSAHPYHPEPLIAGFVKPPAACCSTIVVARLPTISSPLPWALPRARRCLPPLPPLLPNHPSVALSPWPSANHEHRLLVAGRPKPHPPLLCPISKSAPPSSSSRSATGPPSSSPSSHRPPLLVHGSRPSPPPTPMAAAPPLLRLLPAAPQKPSATMPSVSTIVAHRPARRRHLHLSIIGLVSVSLQTTHGCRPPIAGCPPETPATFIFTSPPWEPPRAPLPELPIASPHLRSPLCPSFLAVLRPPFLLAAHPSPLFKPPATMGIISPISTISPWIHHHRPHDLLSCHLHGRHLSSLPPPFRAKIAIAEPPSLFIIRAPSPPWP